MHTHADLGTTRDEALNMMKEYLKAETLQKHSLATEVIILTHASILNLFSTAKFTF